MWYDPMDDGHEVQVSRLHGCRRATGGGRLCLEQIVETTSGTSCRGQEGNRKFVSRDMKLANVAQGLLMCLMILIYKVGKKSFLL